MELHKVVSRFSPWFWAPLLLLVFGSCDSSGISPDERLNDGVALSGPDNTDVVAVATHRSGEWLAAYSRDSSDRVREVVYGSAEGDRATVILDSNGRPFLAVTGPYVLAFGNYNGNRTDVGLVNIQSGNIKMFAQVDFGVDFGSRMLSGSDSTDVSPVQAAEVSAHGIIAFTCSIASMPVSGVAFAGAACESSTLLDVLSAVTEQDGWDDTAELVGWGGNTLDCTGNYGDACTEILIDVSGTVLQEAQAQIDNNNQHVGQASGVVRFGGAWAYRDIDQAYFIIKEKSSYDITYNNFGECYYVSKLTLTGFDGDIFSYRVRENGNTFQLEFDRISEGLLTATRLGDGKEFKWDWAPSETLQAFLEDECGSSSAARTSATLSQ